MSSNANRRLLVTALVLAWFGAFAAADAVGQGWGAAVPLAVAAISMAIVYYVWGGRDSDFAALLVGGRADERQALVRTRARAAGGVACLAGLRRYGDRGEGDDRQQRPPRPLLTWWGGGQRTAGAPKGTGPS
jgi:hypothetical protein